MKIYLTHEETSYLLASLMKDEENLEADLQNLDVTESGTRALGEASIVVTSLLRKIDMTIKVDKLGKLESDEAHED